MTTAAEEELELRREEKDVEVASFLAKLIQYFLRFFRR